MPSKITWHECRACVCVSVYVRACTHATGCVCVYVGARVPLFLRTTLCVRVCVSVHLCLRKRRKEGELVRI